MSTLFSPQVMIVSVVLAVTGIAALVAITQITPKLNVLYFVAAIHALANCLGESADIAAVSSTTTTAVKLTRIFSPVLLVVLAVAIYRVRRLGPAGKALMVFSVLYVSTAIWSPQPFWALVYKGIASCTFLGGLALAYGTRDVSDFIRGLRIFAVIGGAFGLLGVSYVIQHPEAAFSSRAFAFGMSPPQVGGVSAPILLMCVCLVFHDRSLRWKAYSMLAAGSLLLLILFAGARGPLGVAVIGSFFLALPLVKHPVRLLIGGVVLGAFVFTLVQVFHTEAFERFKDYSPENRYEIWKWGWNNFKRSPLVGQGWLYVSHASASSSRISRLPTANAGPCWNESLIGERASRASRFTPRGAHNMYIQVLAESGLLGVACFLICGFLVMRRTIAMCSRVRRNPNIGGCFAFAPACLLAILAHGLATAAPLSAETFHTMSIGFCVGLVDQFWKWDALDLRGHAVRQKMAFQQIRTRYRPGSAGPEPAT
ncbi:MAG: O-antigen ligase family protein [Pirellulales bacterium]|nr:O-antigen ligase family protein [Pirellulales bacterium]